MIGMILNDSKLINEGNSMMNRLCLAISLILSVQAFALPQEGTHLAIEEVTPKVDQHTTSSLSLQNDLIYEDILRLREVQKKANRSHEFFQEFIIQRDELAQKYPNMYVEAEGIYQTLALSQNNPGLLTDERFITLLSRLETLAADDKEEGHRWKTSHQIYQTALALYYHRFVHDLTWEEVEKILHTVIPNQPENNSSPKDVKRTVENEFFIGYIKPDDPYYKEIFWTYMRYPELTRSGMFAPHKHLYEQYNSPGVDFYGDMHHFSQDPVDWRIIVGPQMSYFVRDFNPWLEDSSDGLGK
jgi:hypothetical protein